MPLSSLTDLIVDNIVFREAIEAEGAVFTHVCELRPRRDRAEAGWPPLSERDDPQLVKAQEPRFREDISPAPGRVARGSERGATSSRI
jgi:hypothetical protein